MKYYKNSRPKIVEFIKKSGLSEGQQYDLIQRLLATEDKSRNLTNIPNKSSEPFSEKIFSKPTTSINRSLKPIETLLIKSSESFSLHEMYLMAKIIELIDHSNQQDKIINSLIQEKSNV